MMAATLLSVPSVRGDDIRNIPDCRYCGMDRKFFAHSRMLVEYADGTVCGTCSLNCAAIDYVKNLDNPPRSIKVGDYATKKLIDARKAFWVIGGSKRGVMTDRAKWAFERKRDALAFVKESGGTLAGFDQVMQAGYVDLYKDMRLVDRKLARAHHVGTCQ